MSRIVRGLRGVAAVSVLAAGAAVPAHAEIVGVRITEWMYQGTNGAGEFVEFTNFGPTAVNFSGWSFDDDSRNAGTVSLSGFGLVNPGQSVILTEATASDFRSAWGLTADVKVIGGNTTNLGRADEINLFDNSGALVDRLTFGDSGSSPVGHGPRTNGSSGRPGSAAAIGANSDSLWVLSTVGDVEGSWKAVAAGTIAGGEIGSPGKTSYAVAPVPLPAGVYLLLSGLGMLGAARRRFAPSSHIATKVG